MIKTFKHICFTAVVFFAVTMPFRELFKVMEVTEMRPAGALPPVFGLMLGIPGALGCAVGNLAADILSGYSPLLCVLGFMSQFIYGAFPFVIWKLWRNAERCADEPPVLRLNNVKNVLRYIIIILVNSLLMAALLGAIMKGFGISMFFSTATLMVFLNNFVFCMVLGIPILMFMSIRKARGGGLSLNERLVLIFLLTGVISAGTIGFFAYAELSRAISHPLEMWNRIFEYMAASLFISFFITVMVLRYAEKNVTIPIESLAGIMKTYVSDGREKKHGAVIASECEMFSAIRNETGILAGVFQKMVLDLETYIENMTKATAEKERIGAELSIATKIQASMLPRIFPPFPDRNEFDIYASMLPAKEVGGDFYDFFMVGRDKLAVVIADVSCKGVPAALFMVVAKTLIKYNAQEGKPLKEVFDTVNNLLCENNDAGMFVTAFMGILDIPTGKFSFVNAGHNAPLIKRVDGKYEFLKIKPALILAAFEGTAYREDETDLLPGDMLYLYTDGVTEAMNTENELFSDPRLLETANRYKDCDVKELLESIKKEVDLFANGAEQADDVTMLALRYKGC